MSKFYIKFYGTDGSHTSTTNYRSEKKARYALSLAIRAELHIERDGRPAVIIPA